MNFKQNVAFSCKLQKQQKSEQNTTKMPFNKCCDHYFFKVIYCMQKNMMCVLLIFVTFSGSKT